MADFVTPPALPKCDIILSQEEYEMVMRHRAMKRFFANNHSDLSTDNLIKHPIALRF